MHWRRRRRLRTDIPRSSNQFTGLFAASIRHKTQSLFHKFFGKTEKREINKEAAYRFAMCFASTKFLTGHGARQATQQQLNLINAEHLALIEKLLDLPDETLTETPFRNDAGTLGDVVQAALHVYFHHSDFGPQGARLRKLDYGFIQSPHPTTLIISSQPMLGEPEGLDLNVGAKISVLGIELETKRRNRMNGTISRRDDQQLYIDVDQSFGNCPRYIHVRKRHRRFSFSSRRPLPCVDKRQTSREFPDGTL